MNPAAIVTNKLNLYYGNFHALIDVNLAVPPRTITSLIGPSGCGKSTLLRVFNRMNDLIEGVRVSGKVLVENSDIYGPDTDLVQLRRKVGMVFQRPNPFPLSVCENIVFGPKIHRTASRKDFDSIVENSLRSVMLWEALKDKLQRSALSLTLEQQQRLCVARLLPVKPEILLMDEPCSALDPLATEKIEELMRVLKKDYSIIIVTHNMQQAARVADHTGFMLLGELVEFGETKEVFTRPRDQRTDDYITGRYG